MITNDSRKYTADPRAELVFNALRVAEQALQQVQSLSAALPEYEVAEVASAQRTVARLRSFYWNGGQADEHDDRPRFTDACYDMGEGR